MLWIFLHRRFQICCRKTLWSDVYRHGDVLSSFKNLSRPNLWYVSQGLQKILEHRCQSQLHYGDNGKTFVGSFEELKKFLKFFDNEKICKASAIAKKWKFSLHIALILALSGSVDSERQWNASFHSWIKKLFLTPTSQSWWRQSQSSTPDRWLIMLRTLAARIRQLPTPFSYRVPSIACHRDNLKTSQLACLQTWKNTQKLMNHVWRRFVKQCKPTLSINVPVRIETP